MSKHLLEMITNQDIYGHPIGINYKGSGTYKTLLGAFVTLITKALMIYNTISLTLAYFDRTIQVE